MKMTKVVSVAAAAALATSMVAVCASAASFTVADSNASDGTLRLLTEEKNYKSEGIGLFTQGNLDITSVYGFKITFTADSDVNAGVGGGCGFNSQSTGWKSMEWGNKDAGKELSVDENNVITYLSDSPVFKATDTYAQIWIQCWWQNADVTVESIQALDKDGNVIDYAAAIADAQAAAEAEAAVDETTAETEATVDATVEETVEETAVEETVEETVEEVVDEEAVEDVEEDAADEEADEEAADETAGLDLEALAEANGTLVASDCESNGAWGQAAVLYTYNNIGEDEEPGENPFDVSMLNANSAMVVFYDAETAPELVLQSWSGGEGWAKVPANETYSKPGMAVFTYDYMTAMYQSEDFSTVDAVNIGDTGTPLTVSAAYVVDLSAVAADVADDTVEATVEATVSDDTATTVTADTQTTDNVKTGNTSAAAIAAIMAVAGAAVVAARKRK